MTELPSKAQFEAIALGYSDNPHRTSSLRADAYTAQEWFNVDLNEIIAKTWQWVGHVEKLRNPGQYIAVEVAGRPIAIVRDHEGVLRAFYNVCKHRAHELLSGAGTIASILCPYHAWVYKLDGQLARAPHTESLINFNKDEICLDQVQVEEFCPISRNEKHRVEKQPWTSRSRKPHMSPISHLQTVVAYLWISMIHSKVSEW